MLNEFSDRDPAPASRVPPTLQYVTGGVIALAMLGMVIAGVSAIL